MPLFRALAKNMAPMTNADESPTNRLTLFPIYLSLFVVSTLCFKSVEIRLDQAVRTHPDIGLMTKTFCNLRVFCYV